MDRKEALARNAAIWQGNSTAPIGSVPVQGLDEINALYDQESDLLGDVWTSLLSGGTGLGASAIGAVEGAVDVAGWDEGADWVKGIRQKVAESAAQQLEGLSPRGKSAIQKKFLAEDMGDSAFVDYYSLATQFAQTAPSILIGLLPATMVAKIGILGAAAAGGGLNAAVVSGDTWNAVSDELEAMPETELMSSPRYREFLNMGMEPADARDALIDEVAGLSAGGAGVVSGLTQMVPTGGLAASRLGKGLSQRAMGRAATGFAAEGTQEAIEEGAQAFAEQAGVGSVTGEDVDFGEVAERSVAGATLGGGMGAGVNVALGRGPKKDRGVDDDVAQALESKDYGEDFGPPGPPPAPIQGPPSLPEFAAQQNEARLPIQGQGGIPAPTQGPLNPAALMPQMPSGREGLLSSATPNVQIPNEMRPQPMVGSPEEGSLNAYQRNIAADARTRSWRQPSRAEQMIADRQRQVEENTPYGPPPSGAMQRDFDLLQDVEDAMVGATDAETRRMEQQQRAGEQNLGNIAREIIDGVPALQYAKQVINMLGDWQATRTRTPYSQAVSDEQMDEALRKAMPAFEQLQPTVALQIKEAMSRGETAEDRVIAVARLFDPEFNQEFEGTPNRDTTDDVAEYLQTQGRRGNKNLADIDREARKIEKSAEKQGKETLTAVQRAQRREALAREANEKGLFGKEAENYVREETLIRGYPKEGEGLPGARVEQPDDNFADAEDRAANKGVKQQDMGAGIVGKANKEDDLSTNAERSQEVLRRLLQDDSEEVRALRRKKNEDGEWVPFEKGDAANEYETWLLEEEQARDQWNDMEVEELRKLYKALPSAYRQSNAPKGKTYLIRTLLHAKRVKKIEEIEAQLRTAQQRRKDLPVVTKEDYGEVTPAAGEGQTIEQIVAAPEEGVYGPPPEDVAASRAKKIVGQTKERTREAPKATGKIFSYHEGEVAFSRAMDRLENTINRTDREGLTSLVSHARKIASDEENRKAKQDALAEEKEQIIQGQRPRLDVQRNFPDGNARAYVEAVGMGFGEEITIDPSVLPNEFVVQEYPKAKVIYLRNAMKILKEAGLLDPKFQPSTMSRHEMLIANTQLGGALTYALNDGDRQHAQAIKATMDAAVQSLKSDKKPLSDKEKRRLAKQPRKGEVGPPSREQYVQAWYDSNKRNRAGTEKLAAKVERLTKVKAKLEANMRAYEKAGNTGSVRYAQWDRALNGSDRSKTSEGKQGIAKQLEEAKADLAKRQDKSTELAQRVKLIEKLYKKHNLRLQPAKPNTEVEIDFSKDTNEVRAIVMRTLGEDIKSDISAILNASNDEYLKGHLEWMAKNRPEAMRRLVLNTVAETAGLPTSNTISTVEATLRRFVAENGVISGDASVGTFKVVYEDAGGTIRFADGNATDRLLQQGLKVYQMPFGMDKLSKDGKRLAWAALDGGEGSKAGRILLEQAQRDIAARPGYREAKKRSKPKQEAAGGGSTVGSKFLANRKTALAPIPALPQTAREQMEAKRSHREKAERFEKAAARGMNFQEAKALIQEHYGQDEIVDRVLMQMETRNLRVRILPGREMDAPGEFTQGPSGLFITLDPEKANAKTLLHELVHAYTAQNVATDWRLRDTLTRLMQDAQRQFVGMGEKPYGFENVQEFVAEAFSDKEFQALLGSMKPMKRPTLWKRLVRAVGRAFGFDQGMPENKLAAIMRMEDDIFAIPDPQKKLANLTLQDMTRTTTAITSTMQQTSEALTGTDPGSLKRAAGFQVLTRTQFGRVFNRLFNHEGGNPMASYVETLEKRSASVHKHVTKGEDILRDWGLYEAAASQADLTAFKDVVSLSQVYNLDPRPGAKQLDNVNKQALAKAQSAWNKLSDEGQKVFNRATAFGEHEYKQTAQMLVTNVLDALGVDMTYDDLRNIGTKKGDLDAALLKGGVEKSELKRVRQALSEIVNRPKVQGPYIPLRRFGKWVVDYSGGWTQKDMKPEQIDALVGQNPAIKVRREKQENGLYTAEFKARIVSFAETKTEIEQKQKELDDEWAALKKQFPQMRDMEGTVPGGIGTKDEMRLPPNESASRLMDMVRKRYEQDESMGRDALKQIEIAFISLLPATSIQQAELRRKGVKGFSTDFRRAFAEHYRASAYYLAQLQYGSDAAKGLRGLANLARDAQKKRDPQAAEMGQVVQELRRRDEKYAQLSSEPWMIDKLSEFGFFTYLVSPSYWFVNATQPFLTTLPVLGAKYGNANAGRAMKQALEIVAPQTAKLAWKEMLGFKLARGSQSSRSQALNAVGATIKERIAQTGDKDLQFVIQQLEDRGLIDLTFSLETREAAEGEARTRPGRVWQAMMDMGRYMPHTIEVNNRMMAGIATYYAAKRKGITDPKKLADIVADTVDMTQFNYSAENKAPLMRNDGLFGPLSRPLMMFKQYAQHMYFLLAYNARQAFNGDTAEDRKAARKVVVNVLGAHTAAGGALGGLMIEPIRWALGLAGLAFGDDDDPDEFWDDIDAYMMRNYGNTLAGEMLLKGGFRPLGIDLSQRVGLDNMLFMDLPPEQRPEDKVTAALVSLLGPLAAVGINYGKAYGQFDNGDLTGGFISSFPKGWRDVVKAGRLMNTGMVDSRGKVIYPANNFDPIDVFIQAMGLSPTEVARIYENRGAVYAAKGELDGRKNALRQRYYNASTVQEKMRILREVRNFNRANPQGAIDLGQLRRGAQQRKETERRSARTRGAPVASDNDMWLAREYGVN